MSIEGVRIVQDLSDLIDRGNATLVNDVSVRVAAAIAPWVVLGLIVAAFGMWMSLMRSPDKADFEQVIRKFGWAWCVITLALGAGLYQGSIAPWLMTAWDRFAAFIIPGANSTAAMVDQATERGLSQIAELWARASWSNWVLGVASVLLLVVFCVVIGIGTIYVVIAKIGVGILTALGPMFIVALISAGTSRFFTLWLGQWINYGLIVVAVSTTFTMVASLIGNFVADIRLDASQSVVFSLAGAFIASLAGAGFLVKVNSMVSALAGGAALGGFLSEYRTGSQAVRGAIGSAGTNVAVPRQGANGIEHSIRRVGQSGLLGAGSRATGATRAAIAFARR
jgi:hypothetical protein